MKTLIAFAALSLSLLTAQARDITFTWDVHPVGQSITEFRLYKQVGPDWVLLGSTRTQEVTATLPEEVTVVAVVAVNSVGLTSARSEPLTVPLTPTPPKGLRIKITVELQSSTNSKKWDEVASIDVGSIKPPKGMNRYRLVK